MFNQEQNLFKVHAQYILCIDVKGWEQFMKKHNPLYFYFREALFRELTENITLIEVMNCNPVSHLDAWCGQQSISMS